MFNKVKYSIIGLVVGFGILSVGFAAQDNQEKEVVVGVNEAFIPDGFDTGSDAYAVVSGLFNNGCYRYKRADVEHDYQSKIHEVRVVAGVSQGMCIMVLVPYTKEVRLGKLPAGENTIRFVSGDGTYMEKKVTID